MTDMLAYFVSYQPENEDVLKVCQYLNTLKKGIEVADYSIRYDISDLFHKILDYAKRIDDEKLANAQYVFSEYFHFFVSLSTYFQQLKEKEYRQSWDTLQNCFDMARSIGRFVEPEQRLDIPMILELLVQYEKLYPFTLFASGEYVISQSHCSICGKSMLGLECQHRKGQLYWGEMAVEIIDKVEKIQAIAVVSNPEDKRCVFESEQDTNNNDKYAKLEMFLNLGLPPLRMFTVETQIETRLKENASVAGRNDLCPCGSGKKYKRCCGLDLYYKHEKNTVKPGKKISFLYF